MVIISKFGVFWSLLATSIVVLYCEATIGSSPRSFTSRRTTEVNSSHLSYNWTNVKVVAGDHCPFLPHFGINYNYKKFYPSETMASHNDLQHNKIQHYNIQHNSNQHNNMKHNANDNSNRCPRFLYTGVVLLLLCLVFLC